MISASKYQHKGVFKGGFRGFKPPPPRNFQIFFLESEGKEVERKRKKMRRDGRGGLIVNIFLGSEIFSSGVQIFSGGVEKFSGGAEKFSGGGLRNFRGGGLRNFRGGGGGLTNFRQGLGFFREGLGIFREGLKFFREGLRFFREGLNL